MVTTEPVFLTVSDPELTTDGYVIAWESEGLKGFSYFATRGEANEFAEMLRGMTAAEQGAWAERQA